MGSSQQLSKVCLSMNLRITCVILLWSAYEICSGVIRFKISRKQLSKRNSKLNDFKRNYWSSNKKIRLLKSFLTLKGVHQIVRQSYKEFNQAETQTCRGNLRKKACLVHLRKIIMKSNWLTSSLKCKEKRITKTCFYIVLITSVICKQIMALQL